MSRPKSRTRKDFEWWIKSAPYEKSTERYDNEAAWPGQYKDYEVELAWEAWQKAQE